MEDLIHDLPFPVEFEQGEHVGEPGTGPIVELKPDGSHCAADIDTCDVCFAFGGGAILVIPVKKYLDGTGEEVLPDITENRGVLMKGRLHVGAFAGFGSVDVMPDSFGDQDFGFFRNSPCFLCYLFAF